MGKFYFSSQIQTFTFLPSGMCQSVPALSFPVSPVFALEIICGMHNLLLKGVTSLLPVRDAALLRLRHLT